MGSFDPLIGSALQTGKVFAMAYDVKWKTKETEEFVRAILLLESEEDCYRFFDDIFTVKEIQSIAQRLHVARLLSEKKTYVDIEKETNASTATISRVNRSLSYGADGYKLLLQRLEEAEK